MRKTPVNILKYAPEFLFKDTEFKAVGTACNSEHEKIRLQVQDVFRQLFIDTATWGLAYYENVLEISPKPTDSYEQRRNRILLLLQSNQTSTKKFITELVNRYITNKSADVIEHNEDYVIEIRVPDGKVTDFTGLIHALEIYLPAHIGLVLNAYIKASGEFKIGGIVTQLHYSQIPADTEYNISIASDTKLEMAGVVTQLSYMHIPANIYK